MKASRIMSILCGIDFSPSSARATEVAAAFAARLHVPLRLVHALPDWLGEVYGSEKATVLTAARQGLEKIAKPLRDRRIELEIGVELDPPEKALIRSAAAGSTSLLVFGATGRGEEAGRPVGSIADRIAQWSQVPALVIRAVEPFDAWFKGQRPLKVVCGIDFNLVSEDAWRWATALAAIGPIDLVAAYFYWPPYEFSRLGLGGVRSFVDPDLEVQRILRKEMSDRFKGGRSIHASYRPEPNIGSVADHLLSLAREEKADLIVVGSHRRSAIDRLWEGSVSRGTLHRASASICCVPLSAEKRTQYHGTVRVALAGTDFSPSGNAAVDFAYAQVAPGGKVYLAHVLPPPALQSVIQPRDIFAISQGSAEAQATALQKLRALIPLRRTLEDKMTEVLVLESREPAEAIAQAAERLGVDIIVLGTRGKGGIKGALGSVARAALTKTARPLLLVRSQEE
jgi:nucleotide-binding universal stress UspA family protein